MVNTYEVNATYGSRYTPCNVFVVEVDGCHWYAIEDSKNVCCSPHEIANGADLEIIEDTDYFGADDRIESIEQLEREVLEYLGMAEPEDEDEDGEETARFESVQISIDEFGHSAMVENYNGEVARMLRELAARIDEYGLMNIDGVYLRDSNGNTVGSVSVTGNPDY